jgi:hypothetical protein
MRKPADLSLPKSKSSTHLLASRKQPRSGQTTPGGTKLKRGITKDELNISTLSARDRNDSDWLLRAGAAISSSTRESKGQSWLVSRASSTSLTRQRDEDEEELERELAREREQTSRRASRRGSVVGAFDADDEFSPLTARRSLSFGPTTGHGSRPTSRFGSRGNSRRGSRAQLFTPVVGEREGYFDQRDFTREEYIAEPDFVDMDEEALINDENEEKNDEAIIKKLARASNIGLGGWVEKMLGWSLFAVDEDVEDEAEMTDEKDECSEISSRTSRRTLDGVTDPLPGDVPPPLRDDEAGGWQDAAWLLSVATKVLL